jgi:NaMN:DMB phosphoribosyltransferase
MSRSESLALRRAALIALCGSQRRDLALTVDDVGRSLWVVDAAVAASRRAAARPALLAGFVVVAAVVLRPSRIVRLLTWGLPAVLSVRRAAALWLNRRHHGRDLLDD